MVNKKKVHSIQPHLALGLLVAAAVVIAWFGLHRIEEQTRQETGNTVQSVLKVIQEALHIWTSYRKADVSSWATSEELIRATQGLLELKSSGKEYAGSSHLTVLNNHLLPAVRKYRYLGYHIISPDFTILASLNPEEIGTSHSLAKHKAINEKIFMGETIVTPPMPGKYSPASEERKDNGTQPAMCSFSPIRNQDGEIIAILSFIIDPKINFTRISHLGRIGKTGETYAFDKEGRQLTKSRFDDQLVRVGLLKPGQSSILKIELRDPGGNLIEGFRPTVPKERQPWTQMATSAIMGESGVNIKGYRDYRGVRVLGAWLWDPKLNIGLATEIDESEVLVSFKTTRVVVVGTLALTILIFVVYSTTQAASRTKALKLANILDREKTRLNTILKNAEDGILTFDSSGAIESFNPAAERIFGYRESEVKGKNLSILIPEREKNPLRAYSKNNGNEKFDFHAVSRKILQGCRKDGSIFPMELGISEMTLGKEQKFTWIIRDITQKEKREQQLEDSFKQLRDLSRKLESVREEERTAIAQEVHDEIGQMLTALKLDLGWLYNRVGSDDKVLLEKITSMDNLLDNLIQTVQRISGDLRPEILDVLGLCEAIEWQAREFEGRTGINCKLVLEPPHVLVDSKLATAIFRIFQETLTNIARHANARNVYIRINKDEDSISLEVTDDGIGIPEEKIFNSKSLGLIGMRERASTWGGEIQIRGIKGKGTSVYLQVPLKVASMK